LGESQLGKIESWRVTEDRLKGRVFGGPNNRVGTPVAIRTSRVYLPHYIEAPYSEEPLEHGTRIQAGINDFNLGEPLNVRDIVMETGKVRAVNSYLDLPAS